MPVIVPLKVVLVLSLPIVSVRLPRLTVPPVLPPPASEPIVLSKPFSSISTLLALERTMAEVIPKALLATPARSVPCETSVVPV